MAWKRLKNLQPTEKIGVEVWPNVSTTRDDLSLSKVPSRDSEPLSLKCEACTVNTLEASIDIRQPAV